MLLEIERPAQNDMAFWACGLACMHLFVGCQVATIGTQFPTLAALIHLFDNALALAGIWRVLQWPGGILHQVALMGIVPETW